jgi:membrane fusion protein (multidrug efflux system)
MVADVQISLSKKDSTFIVPKTAVVNSPERVFVVRIANSKAEWVDVKTGRDTDGRIEIYGNLKAGDNLAKKASEEIRQGTSIGNTKLVEL